VECLNQIYLLTEEHREQKYQGNYEPIKGNEIKSNEIADI